MMSNSDNEVVLIQRDLMVRMVPSGIPISLQAGTRAIITQSLGGSFTLNVSGNLLRVDPQDSDALGKTVMSRIDHLPEDASITDRVWAVLKTVFDPEIPVNVVDLGLIYRCDIEKLQNDTYDISVDMTLTAPGCGMGPVIVTDVEQKLLSIVEVSHVMVNLVFDPPWDRGMLSDAAQLQLGML